jgi:hypothetical protein
MNYLFFAPKKKLTDFFIFKLYLIIQTQKQKTHKH